MSTDADSATHDRRQQLQRELLRRARAGTARGATTAEPATGPSTGPSTGRDDRTPRPGSDRPAECVPSPARSAACG
ncbi:hypothetical protein MRQ86_02200 [Streptomyces sp. MMS21 TC-5]|uniref:hypothetical protein n=1 Tax=Streptomyces sp. MMS21 TC-5 TaxID=2925833 RepID=UPI001F61CAD1|nr:hypothetical protein [Streptomyces sp. MMS21 TC-5]MCI4079177.1 hypothetical protein [Streptomyces sp. MMS21 TC-5]